MGHPLRERRAAAESLIRPYESVSKGDLFFVTSSPWWNSWCDYLDADNALRSLYLKVSSIYYLTLYSLVTLLKYSSVNLLIDDKFVSTADGPFTEGARRPIRPSTPTP